MACMIFFIKRKNTPLFDVFMLNEMTSKKLSSKILIFKPANRMHISINPLDYKSSL